MDEQLIAKRRRIIEHKNYSGVCNNCGGAVSYPEIAGIEIFRNEVLNICFPFDEFSCPHCNQPMNFITVWASLDITEEIKKAGQNASR